MRWVSSKESVAKGEVSVLAIVETLCAIALVFYLSAHFNTLRWLAIAMCVAPLLLLRTEESTRRGIELFDRWGELLERAVFRSERMPEWLAGVISALLLPVGLGLLSLVSRISATTRVLFREPGEAIQAIPKNWSRITLAVDSRFAPEIVPDHPDCNFQWLVEELRDWPFSLFALLFIGPFFLPALLYRWSLKATSIVYAPVAHSTFSEGKDLRTKLELIKRGDLSRIRVLYGIAAIAAFLVKLVLMAKWSGFAAWWNGNPITEFLALYVAPSEIPKWQLAELANSALAIGSMLFARHALLRYELGHPFPETPVKRILGFVSGLRWVLALYAIVCTGYITMRAARDWHLPALGEKWIPWQ